MSAIDHLKQAATAIFNQMRDRKTVLQAEYDDLQSKLAHKKVELDSQVDILSSAYQRALDSSRRSEKRFSAPDVGL